jgi:hypothetical protein
MPLKHDGQLRPLAKASYASRDVVAILHCWSRASASSACTAPLLPLAFGRGRRSRAVDEHREPTNVHAQYHTLRWRCRRSCPLQTNGRVGDWPSAPHATKQMAMAAAEQPNQRNTRSDRQRAERRRSPAHVRPFPRPLPFAAAAFVCSALLCSALCSRSVCAALLFLHPTEAIQRRVTQRGRSVNGAVVAHSRAWPSLRSALLPRSLSHSLRQPVVSSVSSGPTRVPCCSSRRDNMSELFGEFMTDELGGADEALALASYAAGTSGASGGGWGNWSSGLGKNAGNPLLKRSKQYYAVRKPGQLVGLDNQSVPHACSSNPHESLPCMPQPQPLTAVLC